MNNNSPSPQSWLMLISRLGLFITTQALFALGFLLAGSATAWEAAANWWPFAVTITNLICAFLMIHLFSQEGKRFWDIFRIQKEFIKKDLLALLGITILMGPIAFLPNIWLGSLLFNDPQQSLDLLVRPLPMWAVVASILLFPITQGLAEIPTYFAYVMPRFKQQGMPAWLAVSLPSLFLGIQHCAVPLLFDLPFFTWRLLMYIPFAFQVGIVLHWRPRLLPYLAFIHILMDLSFAAMLFGAAY